MGGGARIARVADDDGVRRLGDGGQRVARRPVQVGKSGAIGLKRVAPAVAAPVVLAERAYPRHVRRTGIPGIGREVRAGEDLLVLDVGIDLPLPAPAQLRVIAGHGQKLIEVLGVLNDPERELLGVRQARGRAGLFAGLGEDREENRRQNRDYGDNDEQFDQRER